MTYKSIITNEVFRRVASGQQMIEPRIYDGPHRLIKIGDMILFINRTTKQELLTKVVGLLRFDSFKELFNAYPLERFGGESEQDLLQAMRALYNNEQELNHGVVGLKIHRLQ